MQRRRTNYFYSIIGVALVLFLMGLCGIILLFTHHQLQSERDNLSLMVELKDEADSASLAKVKTYLQNNDFAQPGTLHFVSKEEAFDKMSKQFPEETALLKDGPLPFFNALMLNLKPEYLESDKLNTLESEIRNNSAVNDVYIDKSILSELAKNIYKLSLIALGLASAFILVAITLIHNTIRLHLFSDRFIIRNMELVGATWGFISKPYIKRGILNGLLSVAVSIFLLAIIWYFVQFKMPNLNELLRLPIFYIEILVLILLGVLISYISTYYVVNKYLKMRLDELY